MRYKYLLWDIDGTILDFLAAEKNAIRTLFDKFGLGPCSEEMIATYSGINVRYWKMLERGLIKKQDMLVERFREFFSLVNVDVAMAEEFNENYQIALGDTICFMENAKELLIQLKAAGFIQIAVTNGTARAQSKKLKRSGLDQIFDRVFISEEVGAEKPDVKFFERVFSECGIHRRSQVLIIGDSLTSDMQGGINAGIATCWYHPVRPGKERDRDETSHEDQENAPEISVTYEVSSLSEITRIVMCCN